MAKNIADGKELRLVVLDDAAVGRDVDLAIAEGIEGIHGFIGRCARCQMHENLYVGRGDVFYLSCLDFSLFHRLGDAFDEAHRGFAIWNLGDDEGLAVELIYLGSHLQGSATLTVVVFAHVDGSTRWEVRVDGKLFSPEVVDGSIAEVVEVMWQYLAAQSHGDTLGTLCQEQREFSRQGDRLLVAAVVRELPVGGFRVEHHVERKLRESCLNISGSCRTVAREDISPVTLRIDEQVFLSHLHQGIADGSVSMRVELHRVSHDIGHLVVSSVVHAFHGVEDASLHGFQSVFDMRHSSLQNYIRRIVEEPVLIHAAEVVYGGCIESVHRLIVGMFLLSIRILQIIRILAFQLVFIFNFVAHISLLILILLIYGKNTTFFRENAYLCRKFTKNKI